MMKFAFLVFLLVVALTHSSFANDQENTLTLVNSLKIEQRKIKDREWYARKQREHETAIFTGSKIHILRLSPGEDLLQSLWRYARVTGFKAASIVSTVGSLQRSNIRYANEPNGTVIEDYFEIVSLVGNIDSQISDTGLFPSSMGAKEGSGHVHISLSNKDGTTIGGHLLTGNIIYTTAEITLVEMVNGLFTREMDPVQEGGSGYYELKVYDTTATDLPPN